ncbi:glycosyltransferase [Oceanirhabdus sp. W0125-5]|uniref:glycosyltransferase n=1 Tax=Oceanirhabdus sp. W0125-5 TaxID=2999116 RepID=UPI0022F2EE5A|nr:glycosyltransferase [Oceanirhabdus sp. W0125-5]WBW98956.1 glycosyltransferase [Oceanirhabdus sp. W0125-5]
MKKNLLFVIPSLCAGGAEKSLVNLLNQVDYNLYNVDLFFLKHDGIFVEFIPEHVQVLSLPESYKLFALPLNKSIMKFLLKGNISLAYNRLMFALKNRNKKNISLREQYNWKHLKKSLEEINKTYDAAIGFLEKTSVYFCVDKVNATKKIGWIHIDYDKLGMNPDFDIKYFKKLNNIVTVSEECANILKEKFPSEKEKIDVVYNIVSPTMINIMASQDNRDVYNKGKDEIVIISVGRLHYQKGFEMAIEACKILKERGNKIKWNIIGEGEEREKLTNLIKVNKLEDNFKLLGLKANPYPFIKQADIYAQTSKFEGKSIALDEAKILKKPIVVTNYSTAKDQINDDVDGIIVDMQPDAIADGIEKLIKDISLRNKLTNNLAQLKLGTEEEINKLYKLFQ